MKFSKELEEMIDRELAEYEQAQKEGKVEFLSEEEAFEIMFGNLIHAKNI